MIYPNDPDTILRAKGGGQEEMTRLVCDNMGLVKSIALRFLGRGVELEDLIQIGTVGMLRAIQGFDPDRACQFTTYAVPMITGEIKRYLRSDGWIKVGREAKRNAAVIFRFIEEYEKKTGASPPMETVCRETGISEEKAVFAMAASRPAVSLDGEDEETGFSPLQMVGADETEAVVGRLALREAVARLEERERAILHLRYDKNLTQQQTARVLGLSQVKVSREEKKILQKLRAEMCS